MHSIFTMDKSDNCAFSLIHLHLSSSCLVAHRAFFPITRIEYLVHLASFCNILELPYFSFKKKKRHLLGAVKTEIKCYFLEDSLERRLRNVLENEWEVRLLWLMVVPTCGVAILVKSGGGGVAGLYNPLQNARPLWTIFQTKS